MRFSRSFKFFSTAHDQTLVTITNPTSGTTRVSAISFGATDNEVYVFSDFGLKLSVLNLATSKSVDIISPKFYNPSNAAKGVSHRPGTHNLVILTRNGGKDVVSVHAHNTLAVTRSWHPDTIDAQGVAWSPDGRWIAVWDSASQGHKMLIYTADGHLYKKWGGAKPVSEEGNDQTLGAGIKLFSWSPAGSQIALGDYSSSVTILSVPSFTDSMSLMHSTTIKPADTLQIWQEHATPSEDGFARKFVPAAQMICPPMSELPSGDPSMKSGTNILTFDNSGTLLATRAESMPTTLWIWDVATRIIRTVLILHAPIAKATWHPTVNELLLIRCEGEESRGFIHLWDPSWESPKIINFADQIPGGKLLGKTVGRWLSTESAPPALFFSDTQDCMLASVSEPDEGDLPWQDAESPAFNIYGQREESPLNLVPADEKRLNSRAISSGLKAGEIKMGMSGIDEVDDTFRFRKFG
ncbi:hypothetical protein OIDMADRAFT_100741 [Oidiodendron maius Zn]|uniref:Anaphase-promoting complex subunit 4 WD40 domain-containing protein n=1 Tax=Oidiodendron maius (strain Zn) TaxID=913774 RepID=A0A0C3DUQ5_OIDMZ|nr:hypothetical protein OIDMADRAFT_100741 [Oidiodendron maius Zn]